MGNQREVYKYNKMLYPIYRMLSFDYLFFYLINILFLTQVKNIKSSDIIFVEAFYSIFMIFSQIPANIIIKKTNRKTSLIIGNILNAAYIITIIISKNMYYLIFGQLLNALGFTLKEISAPSILNGSIPATSKKSATYAKLTSKSLSGYHILNGLSMILASIFYEINPYIPIALTLLFLFLSIFMAIILINPYEDSYRGDNETEIDLEQRFSKVVESFKYIFHSSRLKSLILFSSVMISLIHILLSSEIYLLTENNVSIDKIGIILAILELISGIATKKQHIFQEKFKNKSLSVIGITISLTLIVSTIGFIFKLNYMAKLIIVLICLMIKYAIVGIYYVLIEKYLTNFTNEEIDYKIYTVKLLCQSIFSATLGMIASKIMDKFGPIYSILIYGIGFFVLFLITIFYMRGRVGKSPEEYPEVEMKYSNITKTNT